jgi:hypothetical protein
LLFSQRNISQRWPIIRRDPDLCLSGGRDNSELLAVPLAVLAPSGSVTRRHIAPTIPFRKMIINTEILKYRPVLRPRMFTVLEGGQSRRAALANDSARL